jgi:hypothetical protein
MQRLNYGSMILLTIPFVLLGLVIGLFECVVGSDGSTAEFVVRPFIWAYRRKV